MSQEPNINVDLKIYGKIFHLKAKISVNIISISGKKSTSLSHSDSNGFVYKQLLLRTIFELTMSLDNDLFFQIFWVDLTQTELKVLLINILSFLSGEIRHLAKKLDQVFNWGSTHFNCFFRSECQFWKCIKNFLDFLRIFFMQLVRSFVWNQQSIHLFLWKNKKKLSRNCYFLFLHHLHFLYIIWEKTALLHSENSVFLNKKHFEKLFFYIDLNSMQFYFWRS